MIILQPNPSHSMLSRDILIFFFLLSFYSVISQPKVVVVLLDGIPTDVIKKVDTPNIDDISEDGGFINAYVGGVIGTPSETPTISAPGYMSMLTGTWANKHQVYDNNVDNPDYSFHNFFKILKSADKSKKIGIFSTWQDNRTKLIGENNPAAGDIKFDYFFDGLEHDTVRFKPNAEHTHIKDIDELVAKEAARIIRTRGPDLSWVYLQYTDDVGHLHGDGPLYYQAVQFADSLVGRVWKEVKYRQLVYGEDWMIIVLTDHGRDAETGKSHGGQTARERAIWMTTNQKTIANIESMDEISIVDVMPTILSHLQVQIPEEVASRLDGQSILTGKN